MNGVIPDGIYAGAIEDFQFHLDVHTSLTRDDGVPEQRRRPRSHAVDPGRR